MKKILEKGNAGGNLFEKRSSPRTPLPKTLNILAAPVGRRLVFANPDAGVIPMRFRTSNMRTAGKDDGPTNTR